MEDSLLDSVAGAMEGASLAVTARASLRAVCVAFLTAAEPAFWMAPPRRHGDAFFVVIALCVVRWMSGVVYQSCVEFYVRSLLASGKVCDLLSSWFPCHSSSFRLFSSGYPL